MIIINKKVLNISVLSWVNDNYLGLISMSSFCHDFEHTRNVNEPERTAFCMLLRISKEQIGRRSSSSQLPGGTNLPVRP